MLLTFSCSGVNVAAILFLTEVQISQNITLPSNHTDTRLNFTRSAEENMQQCNHKKWEDKPKVKSEKYL